ncbi:MAG: alpha/beta hydrolase [Acidobacteria bacterium]|nr:alpha/beta hydrolase [Acidobacteriota bacterium]
MLQRICMMLCAFSLIAAAAVAQPAPVQGPPPTGSGPYRAVIEGDPGVPGHTIYRPGDLSSFDQKNPLPIFAWGNGACMNSNTLYAPFLAEIASQGFLVVAIGPYSAEAFSARGGPGGGMMGGDMGGTKSVQLLEALDWATAENKRKGGKYYQKLNPSKFAVSGHSCGGMQALEVGADPRVSTTLPMDSGLFAGGLPKMGAPKKAAPKEGAPKEGAAPKMAMALPTIGKDHLQKLHSPVLYIDGGKSDMAFPNGEDDFARIEKVPIAIAHFDDVGHGGTFSQPNGGEFGKIAVAWLKWQLKGDETAKKMFSGSDCGLCKDTKWEYKKKKM